ncbi:MAG: translation initiation factor IF-2 [Muribaculaceae bacterium]|nr:translation initiation factor IF-2 [Muribaculaceae bacterium]
MMIKISKIAKELNVGVQTAVEFLRKRNIEVESNPNARIDDTAAELLMKEFSRDRNVKEASDNFTSARQERKIARQERTKPEEVKTEVPTLSGPRIAGKVDVSDKNRQAVPVPDPEEAARKAVEARKAQEAEEARKAAEAAEAAAKAEAARKAREAEDARKAEEARKAAEAEKAEKAAREEAARKAQESKLEAAPAAQAPKAEAPKAEPAPAPKPEETHPMTLGEAGGTEVFRVVSHPEAPELKVVGKIDLSSFATSSSSGKKKRRDRKKGGEEGEAGRRKRVKINQKVDVEKAAQQGVDQRKGKEDQNKKNKGQQGGRDKQKQKAPQRQEVKAEDVQKQVKETLARLSNKASKKAAKYRREKREEMHNRELANAEREAAESKILKLTEFVTASDLANMMDIPVNSIIGACMKLGVMVSINQRLDAETINIVAEEFGFTTEYVSAEVSEAIATEEDREEDLQSRPPIVTVMGHVDHGKTSLLDYIRNANVIAGEAGGITQHIGAYNVKLADGRHITFLDTPGHEAFTAMRARGAKVTDLAIIIVAADDSVMPQTVEAINHASAAGVPMVFAINKVDKPTANPDKIKEELANMNYLVEEWGGKYQSQDISAKKGIGVEELMEKVLLEAEMLELRANPDRMAIGSVIESSLDKGRGYVATVLVQNGTLKVGDVILAGTNYGKIKAMFNERNQRVESAGPATPVLVLGLNGAPTAGDTFNVMATEQEAREIAAKREQLQRELSLRTKKRPGLEELGRRRALNDFHELNLVVKGDVDGSIEALSDALIKLSTPEIQVNVLHKGVGAISESDVTLAAASDAIIIGFQVRPSAAARREAEKEGVEIRLYSVIYKAIEEVKDAMEGLLSPEIKEEVTGTAEVLQTYHISKVGTIAGAIVRDGKIKSRSKVRVIRDGIVIYTGELGSLKRFKDDVKEVVSGYDCGLSVQGYNDIREGDLIEAYEEVEVKKSL